MKIAPILLILFFSSCVSAQIIKATPSNNLIIGDPVHINIQGLKPLTQYKLLAKIVDERRRRWQSQIYFTADKNGRFDPAVIAPDSGTYKGVDHLGIFWSAILDPNVKASGPTSYPSDSSQVNFTLYLNKDIVAEKMLLRWFVHPSVSKREIRESGLYGTLYTPGRPSNKAVILLGGSGGGILWQRITGGVLASKGYTCLALAYFRFETLPGAINKIPVEYIKTAINYLKSTVRNDQAEIILIGWSKGAEYALVSASLLDEVDKVVAFAPAHIVTERFEIGTPIASSWTYQGKELPFVLWSTTTKEGRSGEQNWIEAFKDTAAVGKARIKIENSKAKTLLLSGDSDIVWPSEIMGTELKNRAEQMGRAGKVMHISFKDAGHVITRPGFLPTTLSSEQGGLPKGNAYAQLEAWREVLKFLKK